MLEAELNYCYYNYDNDTEFILNILVDMARSKDRNTRLQAAVLMKQTFKGCCSSVLPKLQVVVVGVLLALVRQANTAFACSGMLVSGPFDKA